MSQDPSPRGIGRPELRVILNWVEELKRLVPAN
jgi:hypothetical protein